MMPPDHGGNLGPAGHPLRRTLLWAVLMLFPLAAAAADDTPPDTRLGRQSLRAQQNVLTAPEAREGERRLDAIDRKAQTDPRAARDMQRIWEADRALSTTNRPIPGGPANPNPSLVGPGDRN